MAAVTANNFTMEAMTKRHSENVGEIVETIRLENGCKNESSLKEAFEIPARQIQDEFVKVIQLIPQECMSERIIEQIVVNSAQHPVKDDGTARESRKGWSHNRKLPLFADAVMCLRVSEKRTRQKFEKRWNTDILLAFVEK